MWKNIGQMARSTRSNHRVSEWYRRAILPPATEYPCINTLGFIVCDAQGRAL